MQPLISPVDHESRSNTHRTQEEPLNESTPLITGRQVARSIVESRNPLTTIVVVLLLLTLLIGVFIGIYLMLQEESILPPVDAPLNLVSRGQWDKNNATELLQMVSFSAPASLVYVVHTATKQCKSTEDCKALLTTLQTVHGTHLQTTLLPYNFLVSSNGETFEELGWGRPSPLFRQYANTSLVLAFIGDFSATSPTDLQVEEAKRFFEESISQGRLSSSYTVAIKNLHGIPVYLHKRLCKMSQWNSTLSDPLP